MIQYNQLQFDKFNKVAYKWIVTVLDFAQLDPNN